MTKDEAIKWLIKPVVTSTEIGEIKAKELKAYNMAIEALFKSSVVRCGECKYRYYADNRVPHEKTWVCERFMNEEITSNDFCSWGERKGGDSE